MLHRATPLVEAPSDVVLEGRCPASILGPGLHLQTCSCYSCSCPGPVPGLVRPGFDRTQSTSSGFLLLPYIRTYAHTPSHTHPHSYIHTPPSSPSYRVRWPLFACREPRTEFARSFIRSLGPRSAASVICAVKAWSGCLAAGLSLPVILDYRLVTYLLCPLRSNQSTYPFVCWAFTLSTLSSACRSIPFPFELPGGRQTRLIRVHGSLNTP